MPSCAGPLHTQAGTPFNLWDRRDRCAERANNKEIGLTELFSAEIPHLNAMLRERDSRQYSWPVVVSHSWLLAPCSSLGKRAITAPLPARPARAGEGISLT
ncbi:hypothetical protein MHYP_G00005840 [Metynnis hypsauchen]